MFEILMFLFENYMDNNATLKVNSEAIYLELDRLGFQRAEIDLAFRWLDGLICFKTSLREGYKLDSLAIRHYTAEESERLGVQGRGFLLYLEQIGILDPVTREIVIDRYMAFNSYDSDLGKIKWVVLMVLFNQPDKKTALALMQEMVLADAFGALH